MRLRYWLLIIGAIILLGAIQQRPDPDCQTGLCDPQFLSTPLVEGKKASNLLP
ncbi:MAG: hypothetical protein WAO58_05035 [Fimbriimonadaceae bacterium]